MSQSNFMLNIEKIIYIYNKYKINIRIFYLLQIFKYFLKLLHINVIINIKLILKYFIYYTYLNIF